MRRPRCSPSFLLTNFDLFVPSNEQLVGSWAWTNGKEEATGLILDVSALLKL